MWQPKLSRRRFLKAGAITGALAVGSSLLRQPVGGLAEAAGGVSGSGLATLPAAVAGSEKVIPSLCEMCSAKCGILAYVREGRVVKIEGNPKDPQAAGKLCARGSAGMKTLYDPDRLKSPMKRVGEGKFDPISWDQAFQEIGPKLKELKLQYGPQTLVWAAHPELPAPLEQRFMAAFGSPNYTGHAPTCYSSRSVAYQATYGGVPGVDYQNVRYYIAPGRNLLGGIKNPEVRKIVAARKAGAKIVVLDPRMSELAMWADEWLPIRPGTDGAFMLALMHVIIKEKLYDAEFVAAKTVGFDQLAAKVQEYSPEWAEKITDIPAATITRIARELAQARPAAAVDPCWHAAFGSQYYNSVQGGRAAACLNALLGNLGAKGGLILGSPLKLGDPTGVMGPEPPKPTAPRWDGAGGKEWPLAKGLGMIQTLPLRILEGKPYPIKALIVSHLNPIRSCPDSGKFIQALKQLELVVTIDIQMNDTAYHSHYVLPESTYLERFDPVMAVGPTIVLRQPAVAPLFNTKPEEEIIAGLAQAAGIGQYFNFTLEQYNNALLAPFGITQEQLKAQGQIKVNQKPTAPEPGEESKEFKTPSGKIELASQAIASAGGSPVPVWEPPLVKPQGDKLRLIQGHVPMHTHNTTQNNAYLHALMPENELWIHTQVAARLGIRDGDLVEVTSEVGKVRIKAKVTEAIHPEAVFMAHGFGCSSPYLTRTYNRGASGAALIPILVAPLSGAAAQCETLVTVRKVG
ncbi:MAG: molybdopterin-dependent oxidoreductase [Clostridia bacterium]|nr:molybdopterin-dependent oxidoreductase [Clostridia bacterium]